MIGPTLGRHVTLSVATSGIRLATQFVSYQTGNRSKGLMFDWHTRQLAESATCEFSIPPYLAPDNVLCLAQTETSRKQK